MVIFQFKEVARCGSSHGVSGGIKFAGSEEALEACLQHGYLIIRLKDGSPVPFRIVELEKKADFVIYLDKIKSPEQAKTLAGQAILLPREDAIRLAEKLGNDKSGLAACTGYKIYDTTSDRSGVIVEIEQYPSQLMAIVAGGQMIPLHDELVDEIDHDKQKITVSLAEGLWEGDS
jgi:16S rRNA processing protein RimM